MKKGFVLVVIGLLSVFVLSGCMGSETPPSDEQIMNAMKKNSSNILDYPSYPCGLFHSSIIVSVKTRQRGEYNSKKHYFPYELDVEHKCRNSRSSSHDIVKVKLYKDDFGVYQAGKI